MNKYTLSVLLIFLATISYGQIKKPISWEFKPSKTGVTAGEEIDLVFSATIDDKWYLYSSDFDPELGPMVTTFDFEKNETYELVGEVKAINPKEKYDDIFEGNYTYFRGHGEFRQKVKILKAAPVIKGLLSYQVCTDVDGKCIPYEDDFSFSGIKVAEVKPVETNKTNTTATENTSFLEAKESTSLVAQPKAKVDPEKLVSWDVKLSTSDYHIGDEIEIEFTATIEDNWHLYATEIDIVPGPLPTEFEFEESDAFEVIGSGISVDPKKKFDKIFEGDVEYFEKTGLLKQKIKVLKSPLSIKGLIIFQVCDDEQCLSLEKEFSITSNVADEAVAKIENQEKSSSDKSILNTRDSQDPYSLLGFMFIAFLAGLAAIFTPCVFPMIPMTVSFFTDKAKTRAQGIRNALLYGFSIVLIYTLVGAILAPFMGPSIANEIATNEYLNVFFFLIFLVFALSFFGLFDINLPNSFVNKIDKKADQGGLMGIFFMAFTLVVVSFSCTGPIAGGLLFESAGGQVVKPIAGMFSFGLAFAIPFTLFAIFPEWLNSMPKSGGWLNSVKVVLGFIELGFSFKFLSVADQVSHWGILDREVYLAVWIVVLLLLGFYLLGKIKLPHDSDLKYIPVPRFMLAVAVFTFAVYLVPGMWGAPLKSLSGYLPPMTTQDLNLSQLLIEKNYTGNDQESTLCEAPKYSSFLHLPHGLEGYFDYDQAVNCAKTKDKPMFIDFTGHGCVNCREMEAKVWSDPRVLKILREDYIILALYVDDRTELPENEWYTSKKDGRLKNTIGRQNLDFENTKFENPAQPYYVLLGQDENPLIDPIGYNLDVEEFIQYLEEGKQAFIEKLNKN